MLGSHSNSKVPDSLGVDAVDGNLQYIIFTIVGNSTIGVMTGCDRIIRSIDGNGRTGSIRVTQRNQTGNIGNGQVAIAGNILVKDNFLCLCGILSGQSAGSRPELQNNIQIASDFIIIYIIDGCFLGGNGLGECRSQLFDNSTVNLAVSTFSILYINITLSIHEAEDLVLELLMRLIGLIDVGLLGADIVSLQLFLEELQGVLIIL